MPAHLAPVFSGTLPSCHSKVVENELLRRKRTLLEGPCASFPDPRIVGRDGVVAEGTKHVPRQPEFVTWSIPRFCVPPGPNQPMVGVGPFGHHSEMSRGINSRHAVELLHQVCAILHHAETVNPDIPK